MKIIYFAAALTAICVSGTVTSATTAYAQAGVRCKVIDVDAFPDNRRCTLKCEDGRVREIYGCNANVGDAITVFDGISVHDSSAGEILNTIKTK